jgi:hypothetical protein
VLRCDSAGKSRTITMPWTLAASRRGAGARCHSVLRLRALRLAALLRTLRSLRPSTSLAPLASLRMTLFGMAGSRTYTRGFQPIPSVTEKCYPVRLFRRTVPESSPPVSIVSDLSVTKCDTEPPPQTKQRRAIAADHRDRTKSDVAAIATAVEVGQLSRRTHEDL